MIVRPPLLCGLINRGSFHGHDLVFAYGTPFGDKPGLPDAVYYAEQALLDAQGRGWIERGKYGPTLDQLFMGVGGFPGDQLKRLAPEHRSPVCFHWITKTILYLTEIDCT